METIRAGGYFRVSDEDQLENYSMDAQHRAFSDLCQKRGWEPIATYYEEGRSAWVESIAKRPALRQVLEDVHARKIDVVVTHTIDRLSRNLLGTLTLLQAFSKDNVSYVSVTQEIDFSTPEGRLFMAMLSALAEYFSDLLSLHTRKGMREKAAQGMHNGAPPFGYEPCTNHCFGTNEEHRGCHVVWNQAVALVDAFQRYGAGVATMQALADQLDDLGFRTNSNRPVDLFGDVIETHGRRFTHYSIRDILKNSFFAGWVRYKGELFPGRHQAIISQALFDQVQKQMEKNRSRKPVLRSAKSHIAHLLANLLRCHECGSVLWSQKQGANGNSYYKPPDKGLDLRCAYRGKSFPAQDFDVQVDDLLSGFDLESDWAAWVMNHCMEESVLHASLRKKQSLQGQLQKAEDLYLAGDLDEQRFKRIRVKAQSEIASIYVPDYDDREEALAVLRDFGALWQGVSVGRRNQLLRLLFYGMYANLETKNIIALHPRDMFLAPVSRMAEKVDIIVVDSMQNVHEIVKAAK